MMNTPTATTGSTWGPELPLPRWLVVIEVTRARDRALRNTPDSRNETGSSAPAVQWTSIRGRTAVKAEICWLLAVASIGRGGYW